jgi:hypothetical protein
MMRAGIFVAGICLMTGLAMADARPGVARREFRGRTYFYEPISYYCPVWYAGNGVIATRKIHGVPLWPETHYDKVF